WKGEFLSFRHRAAAASIRRSADAVAEIAAAFQEAAVRHRATGLGPETDRPAAAVASRGPYPQGAGHLLPSWRSLCGLCSGGGGRRGEERSVAAAHGSPWRSSIWRRVFSSLLRQALVAEYGIRLAVPPPELCSDNGVMIAWAGL